MKVLVVDDSKVTQDITKKILTVANHEVETVSNGAAALDMYDRFKPDIVILDYTMPIMDGKETLRRIMKLDQYARVIMATALEDGNVIQECMKKGAIGYLVKPFGLKDLISTIENSTRSKHKSTNTFFSIIRKRIEADIRKMLDPSASFLLKDVEVINQERSPQTFLSRQDSSQIRVVSKIMQQPKIEKPPHWLGYVTEYDGQQNGEVISFIKTEDMDKVGVPTDIDSVHSGGQALFDTQEFFNIINQKVISILSDATNLVLTRDTPRKFDDAKDSKSTWKDVIKAKFHIISNGKTIPLDILLCSNRDYAQN